MVRYDTILVRNDHSEESCGQGWINPAEPVSLSGSELSCSDNIGMVLKKEYLHMVGNKKPGPCRQVPGSNVADRSFKNHLANDPDLYCWFRANHFNTFRLLSYHSFMNRLSLNDPDVLIYT